MAENPQPRSASSGQPDIAEQAEEWPADQIEAASKAICCSEQGCQRPDDCWAMDPTAFCYSIPQARAVLAALRALRLTRRRRG